jgi:hypothetical protein
VSIVDVSELERLEADLSSAFTRAARKVEAVTSKGALNIKQQLQREAQGIAHAPRLPSSIDYEVRTGSDFTEAEIGPREGGAGSLAFFYYGNSKIGPQLPDPMIALEAEGEKFAEHIARVIVDGMLP